MLKLNFICHYDFNKKIENNISNNLINSKNLVFFLKMISLSNSDIIKIKTTSLKNNNTKIMLIKSPFHYKYSKHILSKFSHNISISIYIKYDVNDIFFNKIHILSKNILKNNFLVFPNFSVSKLNVSYISKVENILIIGDKNNVL